MTPILHQAGRFLIYFSLLVIPVANAPITADTLEIKAHLFRILGAAAALLSFAAAATGRPRHPDAVDLALALCWTALAASVFGADSRPAALPGALDVAASLGFFGLARTVFSGSQSPLPSAQISNRLMWVVGLSAVLPALLFLGEYKRIGISDTLGNQNVVSHYLILCLSAPLFVLLSSSPHALGGKRGVSAFLFFLALLWVIWLTAARGAVVGLLVSAAVVAVLWTVRAWRRIARHMRLALCAACVILTLAAPALLYRYATTTDFNVSVRFLSWKYSISLLSGNHLWFGCGPGTFSAAFEKTKLWMTDRDAELLGHLSVNYAHNDYVEFAVEQGALGLTAFLFLVFASLSPPASRWIAGRPHAAAGTAMLAALVASLSQAFFDFPYHVPPPRMLFYILLGAVSAPPRDASEPETAPETARSWMAAIAVMVLSILPALPVAPVYSASMLSRVAESPFKSGRYQEVRHLHAMAQFADPTRSLYAFRRGLGEEQAGMLQEAVQSFKSALELQPYFPNLYFHLGTSALNTDPSRAATAFYAATAFGVNTVALHNLAAMGLALGDSPAAAAIYTEIARMNPEDHQARRNAEVLLMREHRAKSETFRRASEFYQRGQMDLAEPAAERYLKEQPDDPDGIFLYARILFHRNRQEESGRFLKKYLALVPDDPEGYYYLGNVHFMANRYPESLGLFLKAARLNPESPKIHYNLGVSYFSLGDTQSMNDCFDTVLRINPNVSTRPKIEEIRRAARQGRRP